MLRRAARSGLGLLAATAAGLVAGGAVGAPDEPAAPRVMVAWPSGPLEARLALDRPVDAAFAAKLVSTGIHFATDVRNVEEWRRRGSPPPKPPLGTMIVAGASVADEGRTLVLATDPHPREAVYTLDTPRLAGIDPGREAAAGRATGVAYDLAGASVSWSEDRPGSAPAWRGWWPDLDAESSRRLTRGSVEHERGFARLAARGRLTLESLITLPPGRLTLRIEANGPIEATLDGENAAHPARDRAEFALESTGEPADLLLTVPTGDGARPFGLRVTYRKEGDASDTPLGRERQLVPWSPAAPVQPAAPTAAEFPLSGGDRRRGEAVFFGERAKCSACHKVGGKGGSVGPDLSDLSGRPLPELYRDIAEPSAAIHPDFVPYTVSLKDGRIVVGVVRAAGPDAVRVSDTEAKVTEVRRSEIEDLRAGTTSIMPVGLAGAIGEESIRDLLAFLTARAAGPARSGGR